MNSATTLNDIKNNIRTQQQQLIQQELLKQTEQLMNGHQQQQQQQPVGRQGPFKDVKSIIDDFRQKHPETIPRRGRRLKGMFKFKKGSIGQLSSSISNL